MHPPRPKRLPGFSYIGYQRYFLTICTKRPGAPFRSGTVTAFVLARLREHLAVEGFALLAYAFMPDHVHLVVEGLSEHADARQLVKRWKQATGYWYAKEAGRPLWMPGYHDHVIRSSESTMTVVRYVVENPVRAGLAGRMGEYLFAGSDVFNDEELREMCAGIEQA